jgi:CubicO group peptidase (beta-lactamase class C family)
VAGLDLVDGWRVRHVAAAVVGGPARGVLAARGDLRRRSGWASVTKLVTALAVLVAVEEGSVGLDDPAGPPGSTLRHLLAHASGLAFGEPRVVARPGRRRIYSNAGYEVLAGAVAERTGFAFERYATEAVLDPIGMADTRLEGSPAAGLVGPLDDLLRLASELLLPTVVSAATLRLATTVAFPGLAGVLPGFGRQVPMDWGLGFELRDHKTPHWTGPRNSPSTFGHFGRSGSFLWVDPEVDLACAVLAGRDFGPWAVQAWPVLSDAVCAEFAHREP